MNATVRRMRAEDLAAVQALWREYMDHHAVLDPRFTIAPGGEEAFATFVTERREDPLSIVLVAEDADGLLGFLSAKVDETPPVFVERRYGSIYDLAVTRRARRRGIGRRLTEAAVAWFRDLGLGRVEMRALIANPEAMGFWDAMGFRPYLQSRRLDLD